MNSRVLVTGATGFIGGVLCAALAEKGYQVRAVTRGSQGVSGGGIEYVRVGNIGADTDWTGLLHGVDLAVHTAWRRSDSLGSDDRFDGDVAATATLAEACARAGIRRLVHLSSVKVNGEETSRPFSPADVPAPQDAYARSKWAAEQALARIGAAETLGYAIVRAPLVYGPSVSGNFRRLLEWVARGYPLPLGAIRNRRSLVSVWNLADLVERVLVSPVAAGRVWMASDGVDLSTADLVRRIAAAMHRRVSLPRVPEGLLRFAGRMAGKRDEVSRLCGSLQVDLAPTLASLDWSPPVDIDTGLTRTVQWFESLR